MKLETLVEAKPTVNPNGSTTVNVDIPHDWVQTIAEEQDYDFDEALEHLVRIVQTVLDDDQYVEDSFNF